MNSTLRVVGRLWIAFTLAVTCIVFAEPPAGSPPSQPAAAPGFVDEKYDNGKLKSHYSLDPKGLRSGSYALYSEDGKRVERGTYRNDKLEGIRQVYYANGNVQLQETYRNGRLDGIVTENDEKGTAVRAAQFNAGVAVSDKTLVQGVMVRPRSAAMITAELERIRKMKIETVRSATPIPPHEGGNDSEPDREDAVRRLMEYRYLSFVPYEGMKLDAKYCAHDEAAAGILAKINKLDHTPSNPGWPEDRYKFAYTGTSSSNLYVASGGKPLCRSSVDGYMDDSDDGNIGALGHRRWCLNPPMGKTGFASFKGYSAMWAMDHSRPEAANFEYVAYPAPGLYPTTHFGANRAWSIQLNEARYQRPAVKGVKVTITPVEIDRAKNKINPAGKALEMNHESVDLGGYGISNCLVFRPTGLRVDDGNAYLVEVMGLKTNSGQPAVVHYVVEFFKPERGE